MAMRLLWIKADDGGPEGCGRVATGEWQVETATCGLEGLERLRVGSYDTIVASFPSGDWAPDELLEECQRIDSLIPVVIHQEGGGTAEAVRLVKLGAFHYWTAGVEADGFSTVVESALEYRRQQMAVRGRDGSDACWRRFLVGDSQAMENVLQTVRLIGPRRSTVLITGETGTGKEMAARAIHQMSPRAHLPMVSINCSALPENLLEAEMFGHVRGAFTGAVQNRVGRFEQANKSTLLLDEIGEMPPELQSKLLRALQEREIQRVGSSETLKVDVRVIAASNVNLSEQIRRGRFREDLYYRLNVVPLTMPSLRERPRDIPLLVHHFLEKVCRQEEIPTKRVAPEALQKFSRYPWPGNVRQLENAVEMAVALSGNRQDLYPGDFPLPSVAETKSVPHSANPMISVPDEGLDFEQVVGRIERAILEQALRKTGGNKKQAAEMLRLKRTTLAAKLKSLEAAAAG